MPTRYLKPGICDSDPIDRCTPLAECLFYRLLVNVDDYGRLDARPAVVRAKCFPLKDTISNKDTENLLIELQTHGLVLLYHSNGCAYLQLNKWDNIPRSKESKCPPPDGDCIQLHTVVNTPHTNLPVTVTVTETKTVTETETVKPKPKRDCTGLAANEFSQFWEAYPKKTAKPDAEKAWMKNKPPIDLVLKALAWQKCSEQWRKDNGQFVPNPSTYLNQGRWQDEPIQLTGGNVNESFNDQAREGARKRLFGEHAHETG